MKTCTDCKINKHEREFGKDAYRKDGLRIFCKPCAKSRAIKYYNQHKDAIYEKRKEYQIEYRKQNSYKYREKNREKARVIGREYYKNNKQKLNANKTKYELIKRREDIGLRMKHSLSSRIRMVLNGKSKSARTMELLGCEITTLKKNLESQFKEGMSWENYGLKGWHIDHIKPCASFDLTDLEQQKECFHYTNLQPLWAFENLSKGKKYEPTHPF